MIKKIKSKLSIKVFLITSGILIGSTIITFLFFLYIASRTYIAELDKGLDEETDLLVNQLETSTYNDSGALFDRYLNRNNAYLELYDSDYSMVNLPTNTTEFPDGTTLSFENISSSEGEEGVSEEATIFNSITKKYEFNFSNSNTVYILEVTGTRQSFTEIFNSVMAVFPFWFSIVLLISFFTGWFYSNFITKPIKEISKNSIDMANLNFHSKCVIERSDEIGILGQSLNQLSDNLSNTLEELKRKNAILLSDIEKELLVEKKRLEFFSSISHELKTPLTILRGQLEGMIQGIGVYSDKQKYLRKTLNTVFAMEEIVQEILAISRINSTEAPLDLANTNLSNLVSDICYELEDTAALNDIAIHTEMEENIYQPLDTNLIKKVLTNIIINGIKYSSAGSDLYVHLSLNTPIIIFSCLNTNAYIPTETIPNLFNAFYRVESSRNKETGGTGLGLYIVKTGLELHHADYSIENTDKGVLFTIHFNIK